MRIALTGASGFVGRYVLRELLARSLDVTAAGRSVDRLPSAAGLRTVRLDFSEIVDGSDPSPFQLLGEPDLLIHLAWGGLPNYRSTTHVESELPAQLRFLSSCVRSGLRRLVVTGTCYEYGMASGRLTEDQPTHPCTQYGLAKHALHKKLEALQVDCPFELAWLRVFYLYGEGQSNKSLYSLLHTAITRGDTSFDMSGGEQIRDFLPIEVAARLIVDTARLDNNTGTVNICSGVPVTVRDLVQDWIDTAGAMIAMNLGKMPYSDVEPMAFWGDRTKLDTLLSRATSN